MGINNYQLEPPLKIQDQTAFESIIEEIKQEKTLAVDTEANSLYAYHEQVCLIQISSSQQDYIIDPLSIQDISDLGIIFGEPTIEKIFHASEYDLLLLYKCYQFEFRNLFDTMLAAQILGRKKLGLDALLEEMIGVQVNKKYQRANWGKRPLSDEMLQYAQIDTHYLIRIRSTLAAELEKKGLTPIAKEDFARACKVPQQDRKEKENPCWRINGAKQLPPKKAAVLLQLCQYRDQIARKKNLPPFKVLSSKTLFRLADTCPKNIKGLLKLDLPGKKNLQRHAEGLLSAIRSGLESDPVYPPTRARSNDSYLIREKELRDWRKGVARQMNVNSAVVLPRELLDAVASENPTTQEELALILKEVPWRFNKFGDEILSTLKQIRPSGRGQ
jgi:ribonuclease D